MLLTRQVAGTPGRFLESSGELGEARVGGTISPDDNDNNTVAYYLVK